MPPIKNPIPNQNKNTLGIEKYQSLPPYLPKFILGFKSFRNKADGDHHESIDTSRTYRYDTPRTYKYDSIENLKAINNKNIDDEYKDENMEDLIIIESVINKSKEEEESIDWTIDVNEFPT